MATYVKIVHIHVEGCLRVISCNSSTEQWSINAVNHVNIKRGSQRPHIFSSDVMRSVIIKANHGVSASLLQSTQALSFPYSSLAYCRTGIILPPCKSGNELQHSLRSSSRVRTNVRGNIEYFCRKYSHTMCVRTKQQKHQKAPPN